MSRAVVCNEWFAGFSLTNRSLYKNLFAVFDIRSREWSNTWGRVKVCKVASIRHPNISVFCGSVVLTLYLFHHASEIFNG
jgi:hypothetical protein